MKLGSRTQNVMRWTALGAGLAYVATATLGQGLAQLFGYGEAFNERFRAFDRVVVGWTGVEASTLFSLPPARSPENAGPVSQ